MIYLVTESEITSSFSIISVQESISLFEKDIRLQIDSETTGLTPQGKVCDFLSVQIGNDKNQIVIDTTTIDIRLYKNLIESKLCVFANGKFDLMFFYNYDIHPIKVYDVMVAEQAIYLGTPSMFVGLSDNQIIDYMDFVMSIPEWNSLGPKVKKELKETNIPALSRYIENCCGYNLKALCYRYLQIELDKSAKGEIIYNGLTDSVIEYAANDVKYLSNIMDKQLKVINKLNIGPYVKIEMEFVPVCAYTEWCGIYLNPHRWEIKKKCDIRKSEKAINDLDEWFFKEVSNNTKLREPIIVKDKKVRLIQQNTQLSLFDDVDTKPHRTFEWTQDEYVNEITNMLDTKSNEDFMKYYSVYKDCLKENLSQDYTKVINPVTNRIHPVWKQIGSNTGRIICGTEAINLQSIPKSYRCIFTPQDNNLILSADFNGVEARIMASISKDEEMSSLLISGGDIHNTMAKICYQKELDNIDVDDVKKLRRDLREKAKVIEYMILFGSSINSLAEIVGMDEAERIYDTFFSMFKSIKSLQMKNGKFVLGNGYIPCTSKTGGKVFWWDWCFWKKEEEIFKKEGFWDEYKIIKKMNPNAPILNRVHMHMSAKSKWTQRMSLNCPTQHSCAEIFKKSLNRFYRWIIENDLFNEVKICALCHDEVVLEYPKENNDVPSVLKITMENTASEFFPNIPMPVECHKGGHWIH